MNMLKGSFLLKVTALLAAVMTYFYIRNEIASQERSNTSADASYKLIKLTAKVLPVKVRLETTPPDGYRILEDEVTVNPAQVTVIGPEALLETAWTAETAIVDISENTRTVNKRMPIESVAGIHIAGQATTVEVTVPIEKLPEPEAPAPPAEPQ
jgi:YbbR domain-containing protein